MQTRVALTPCASYSPAALQSALRAMLFSMHGWEDVVKPGQSVLIKPNLLMDARPEEAITTHPEVVRALIRMVKERGARPVVGDSPANVVKIESVWDRTGFRAMCAEENTPLLNLEQAGSTLFTVNGISFSIAQPVLDADVVINVPKVKTHVLTTLTAGVKNLYGTVPGFQKTDLHKRFPKPADFGRVIAAVFGAVRPALTIADGIVGMQGEGPSGGKPAALGILAASRDAAALDVCLCRVLGIIERSLPYLRHVKAAGAGETEWAHIEVVGRTANWPAVRDFRVPSTLKYRLIPNWLVALLRPLVWIRPRLTDTCVFCGQCVRACPVGALTQAPDQRPDLAPDKCIGCCCCHELCPRKAIEMTQSPLLTLLRKGPL